MKWGDDDDEEKRKGFRFCSVDFLVILSCHSIPPDLHYIIETDRELIYPFMSSYHQKRNPDTCHAIGVVMVVVMVWLEMKKRELDGEHLWRD